MERNKTLRLFMAVALMSALSACTKGKGGFSSFGPNSGGSNTPTSNLNTSGDNQVVSSQTSPTDAAIAQYQACANSMRPATQLVQACLPVLEDEENSDVVSQGCINSMHALFAAGCDQLTNAKNNTRQACATEYNQYFSYLPSNCQQAIQVALN